MEGKYRGLVNVSLFFNEVFSLTQLTKVVGFNLSLLRCLTAVLFSSGIFYLFLPGVVQVQWRALIACAVFQDHLLKSGFTMVVPFFNSL